MIWMRGMGSNAHIYGSVYIIMKRDIHGGTHMKKILLTVIFCCCLCASTTISIMASSLKNDSEINVFRGEECGNCGTKVKVSSTLQIIYEHIG